VILKHTDLITSFHASTGKEIQFKWSVMPTVQTVLLVTEKHLLV